MLRRWRQDVARSGLVLGCVIGLIAASQLRPPVRSERPGSYPLAGLQIVPGQLGHEDTIRFILRSHPHGWSHSVSLPRSRCPIDFSTAPNTFGFRVADGDTQFFFRPSIQLTLPLPFPNGFPSVGPGFSRQGRTFGQGG